MKSQLSQSSLDFFRVLVLYLPPFCILPVIENANVTIGGFNLFMMFLFWSSLLFLVDIIGWPSYVLIASITLLVGSALKFFSFGKRISNFYLSTFLYLMTWSWMLCVGGMVCFVSNLPERHEKQTRRDYDVLEENRAGLHYLSKWSKGPFVRNHAENEPLLSPELMTQSFSQTVLPQ